MEESNSEDKEIQIPGTIMQLLKPVPYSASPRANWFLINVIQTRRSSRRYFFNMSRYSGHLPNILPFVLKMTRYRNCHIIFFLTSNWEFNGWLTHFSMSKMIAKPSGVLRYPPRKVAKPQPRRKIIINRKPNKKGKASPTQLLRNPKLALASPKERLAHLSETPDPSDLQSPNQTDSEVER